MCRLKEYPPEVKKTLEHSGEVSYIGKRLDDGSIEKDRAQSELNVCESHFEKVQGGLHDKIKGLSERTKEGLKEFAEKTLQEIEGIKTKHFPRKANGDEEM